jgi:hypothetical protein
VYAPILCAVHLHAFGRRFQRGERTDAAVFADLETLVRAFSRLIETDERFVCPAGEGSWVGNIAFAGRDVSLAVSSYLPDTLPALPAGPPRDIESLDSLGRVLPERPLRVWRSGPLIHSPVAIVELLDRVGLRTQL